MVHKNTKELLQNSFPMSLSREKAWKWEVAALAREKNAAFQFACFTITAVNSNWIKMMKGNAFE